MKSITQRDVERVVFALGLMLCVALPAFGQVSPFENAASKVYTSMTGPMAKFLTGAGIATGGGLMMFGDRDGGSSKIGKLVLGGAVLNGGLAIPAWLGW